jgi:hypothetical protein
MSATSPCRIVPIIALSIALCASPLHAEGIRFDASRPEISIIAQMERSRIALSDEVPLTITIKGPAPIKVTLPKSILDADSAQFWRIKGNSAPEIQALGNGQQQWRYVFRLSPFEAGKQIPISLAPFVLQTGTRPESTVNWPKPKGATVEVTTSITALDKDELRPVTQIEPLPPTPVHSGQGLWITAIVVIAGAVIVFTIVRVLRRARRSIAQDQIHDANWALAQLSSMPTTASGAEVRGYLHQLADIVRGFLEFRFQLPALRRTTQELMDQLHKFDETISWDKLGEFLNACDRAKFADDFSDGPEYTAYADLREWAVHFISSFLTSANPTGQAGSRSDASVA